ncbi:MAG: hypothetical protein AAGK09_03250 [Planctomycetota bacterium]
MPIWATPTVLAIAVGVVVIWGSLLPMRFDAAGYVERHGGAWPAAWAALSTPAVRADWSRTDAVDIAANALLYLPLGLLLREALRERRRRWDRVVPTPGPMPVWEPGWPLHVGVSIATIASLSWALESMQALAPMRVPSLSDWLLNAGPGALAATFGPLIVDRFRRLAFLAYTRSAAARHTLLNRLADWRAHPRRLRLASIVAALATVFLVYAWLADWGLGLRSGVNVVPFARHFLLPYDEGMGVLLAATLVYAVAASWLALPRLQRGLRARLPRLVAEVIALAIGVEAVGWAIGGTLPDITEPILAVAGVGLAGLTYALAVAAVRVSCRRHTPDSAYAGPERRQRPHAYPA